MTCRTTARSDAEGILDLVEKATRLGLRQIRRVQRLAELLEELFLSLVEGCRDDNAHGHDLVAASPAPNIGHPFTTQSELLAGLSPIRNRENDIAIDGRHGQLGSKRGLRYIDRHVEMDLLTLADEVLVRLDADTHVEIAGHAAGELLALAAQPQLRVTIHPSGNGDRNRALFRHSSTAPAGWARIGDDVPLTAAVIAWSRRDELTQDGVLDAA